MKSIVLIFDILGAVLSTKMSGDFRSHVKWILILFALATALAYWKVGI